MAPLFLKKILYALSTVTLSSVMLGSLMLSSNSYAVPSSAVASFDYQKVLQEERTWAGLSSKTLRVGDIVWSYSEGGSPQKPTLLLIHGLASSRDTWNAVARLLTPYYHVIIPDLPSSGSTQVPENFDFSVPNVTENLRRFVEAAHIQNNLNIAGHSLGGTTAMLYASQYAFDTKSLFLIGTGGIFKSNNTNYLKNPIYLKQLIVSQPGDLDFIVKKVMYNPPFFPSIIKNEQEKILISQSQETSKIINQLTQLNKLYTPESFAKMLKSIEAPTLILWGKQDQIVNVEVATELKSLLKRAQPPILLNKVGHVPILEAPESVAENYLNFLEKTQHEQPPLSDQNIYK